MASEPRITRRTIRPRGETEDTMPPSIEPKKPAKHLSPRAIAQESFGTWLKETALIVVIALVLSFLVKTFLVQAFFIPSASMQDTLRIGDRILVNKAVGSDDISRGDVVVFKDPGGWLPPMMEEPSAIKRFGKDALTAIGILPADAGEHLIKRVIGLPGDTVECCDAQGRIKVNGESIDEPYLKPGVSPSDIEFSVKVPDGSVWLMGDNRSNSRDSRAHIGLPGGGFVSLDHVLGRAFVIMWPYDHWTSLGHGSKAFDNVPAP